MRWRCAVRWRWCGPAGLSSILALYGGCIGPPGTSATQFDATAVDAGASIDAANGAADAQPGSCQPLSTGEARPSRIQVGTDAVYWINDGQGFGSDGAVMAWNLSTRARRVIAAGEPGPTDLAVNTDGVWWGNRESKQLRFYKPGEMAPTTLSTATGSLGAVAAPRSGGVYYADCDVTAQIFFLSSPQSAPTSVGIAPYCPEKMIVHGDALFWIQIQDSHLSRMTIATGEVTELTPVLQPQDLAGDGDSIYVAWGFGAIHRSGVLRIATTGGPITQLLADDPDIHLSSVSAGQGIVFYAEFYGRLIAAIVLDTNDIKPVAGGVPNVLSMAYAGNTLYWTSHNNGDADGTISAVSVSTFPPSCLP